MRKEDCKVGDKVMPFQKTKGRSFEDSLTIREMQENGYLFIVSIQEDSAVLHFDQNDKDGDVFAYEDFEPYIEPKQEPVDNRPNFFNPYVSGTCDCLTFREKECKFFIKDETASACKNRRNKEGYIESICYSQEAHADYYSRYPKKEATRIPIVGDAIKAALMAVNAAEIAKKMVDNASEIKALKAEKQDLRLELEKQIAFNVGKDEEINRLKSTNGSLLAVIKKKNSIIANCSEVADKDAKEFSELKDKNEKLKERIFNLSLEIVSDKEEIKQLETVINYYEKKRNEKIRK